MTDVRVREIQAKAQKFRPAFGEMMRRRMEQCSDVVFLVADSARAARFECPESLVNQYVECGIAEQNMISVAAGLARGGKKPVVFAFSTFASERGFEQIRLDVAYAGLNVIIVGSEGGVAMGTQGVTHFGWEDVAVMRSLPGMTVMAPADLLEMEKCFARALELEGPAYIRLSGGVPNAVYHKDYDFQVGKSVTLRNGKDATLIAMGTMVSVAMKAAETLGSEGVEVGVVNMHTIKPLDEQAVCLAAAKSRAVLTLEEHSLVNGLGTAVGETLALCGCSVRFDKIGLPDEYPHTVSPYPDMLKEYGLTAESVAARVRTLLS